jgi:hypothetical protein
MLRRFLVMPQFLFNIRPKEHLGFGRISPITNVRELGRGSEPFDPDGRRRKTRLHQQHAAALGEGG